MKKSLALICAVSSLVMADNYMGQRIIGQKFIGKSLQGMKFNNANIQNTTFAFADLSNADFESMAGNDTKIGNDVSFFCANTQGMKYDLDGTKPTKQYIELQAVATQSNYQYCKAIADSLGIQLPYTQQSLPAGE